MQVLAGIDWERWEQEADGAAVRPMKHWAAEVREELLLGSQNSGDSAPWQKFETRIRFRPGEVSLWAGVNGHGKSAIVNQTLLWIARRSRVGMLSFEMTPKSLIHRSLYQTLGDEPSLKYCDEFMQWSHDRVWLLDHQGRIEPRRVLGVIRYMASELDIKHVLVDSLMMVVSGPEDYEGQAGFLSDLCAVAKDHNVHVHLVMHKRKGQSEMQMPGKFDVKGSGNVVDMADNLLIVWRNKLKEADESGERESQPDTFVSVAKQRHYSWEGVMGLWYDTRSYQYTEKCGSRALNPVLCEV